MVNAGKPEATPTRRRIGPKNCHAGNPRQKDADFNRERKTERERETKKKQNMERDRQYYVVSLAGASVVCCLLRRKSEKDRDQEVQYGYLHAAIAGLEDILSCLTNLIPALVVIGIIFLIPYTCLAR